MAIQIEQFGAMSNITPDEGIETSQGNRICFYVDDDCNTFYSINTSVALIAKSMITNDKWMIAGFVDVEHNVTLGFYKNVSNVIDPVWCLVTTVTTDQDSKGTVGIYGEFVGDDSEVHFYTYLGRAGEPWYFALNEDGVTVLEQTPF